MYCFCDFVISSTNKTDRHNITEILLKVALNTVTLTPLFDLSFHDFNNINIEYCQ